MITLSASVPRSSTLERLRLLYQAGFHDAFLDNALSKIVERQIARDEADLQQVNATLAQFEHQYDLATEIFAKRFQAGDLTDTADFMEWNAFCKMRQRLTARLNILRDAPAHAG
jgi:hypothetical protein